MRSERLAFSTLPADPEHYQLDIDQKKHLKFDALGGTEIVDAKSASCRHESLSERHRWHQCPIVVVDSLNQKPSTAYDVVRASRYRGARQCAI